MGKSKLLAERFIEQKGKGLEVKKYTSGTNPYQEGGRRSIKNNIKHNIEEVAELSLPVLHKTTRKKYGPITGSVSEFLKKIRPSPLSLRSPIYDASDLSEEIEFRGLKRRGKHKTKYHTHTTGWYLHGPYAGEPRPGRRAAMIRAYTGLALDAYKHPGRKVSKAFLQRLREQKADIQGKVYKNGP